jgi:hypothetical protein
MAMAAEALAPEAAGAAEGLSPEAATAVSAARAGHGSRLTPEVAKELRRRASRKPKAANKPSQPSDSGSSGPSALSRAPGAYKSVQDAVSSPGARQGVVGRIIFATILGLIALEVVSQVTGRYFNWSLGKGAASLTAAAKTTGLVPTSQAQTFSQQLATAGQAWTHPTPGVVTA